MYVFLAIVVGAAAGITGRATHSAGAGFAVFAVLSVVVIGLRLNRRGSTVSAPNPAEA